MREALLREQLVVLVFEIEGHRYAVDTDTVTEIVRAVQPLRLPKAPAVIAGVINARGSVLPLLDLRVRFGLSQVPLRAHDVFVLVQTPKRRLALRADRASELMRVPRSVIVSLRDAVPRAEFAAGTAVLPDGLLLICDVELFLDEAETRALDQALAEHSAASVP
ncbi:MAG: Positive regulator of CheA protein [Myxococcaceae bacterium]|nr:Positive regulator of CheA protein [Myxococcaceae bacterium]